MNLLPFYRGTWHSTRRHTVKIVTWSLHYRLTPVQTSVVLPDGDYDDRTLALRRVDAYWNFQAHMYDMAENRQVVALELWAARRALRKRAQEEVQAQWPSLYKPAMPDESRRQAFEDECFRYYRFIKRQGWANPLEGDLPTREALFWRNPTGTYGVSHVQAAWIGYNWGYERGCSDRWDE